MKYILLLLFIYLFIEWCIVRPGGLGEGAPTGVINVIDGQAGSIQRADVANFCLGAILDSNFPYLRKTPCISSLGGTGWVSYTYMLVFDTYIFIIYYLFVHASYVYYHDIICVNLILSAVIDFIQRTSPVLSDINIYC